MNNPLSMVDPFGFDGCVATCGSAIRAIGIGWSTYSNVATGSHAGGDGGGGPCNCWRDRINPIPFTGISLTDFFNSFSGEYANPNAWNKDPLAFDSTGGVGGIASIDQDPGYSRRTGPPTPLISSDVAELLRDYEHRYGGATNTVFTDVQTGVDFSSSANLHRGTVNEMLTNIRDIEDPIADSANWIAVTSTAFLPGFGASTWAGKSLAHGTRATFAGAKEGAVAAWTWSIRGPLARRQKIQAALRVFGQSADDIDTIVYGIPGRVPYDIPPAFVQPIPQYIARPTPAYLAW